MANTPQIAKSNPWTDILSDAELAALYALTASLDPSFAAGEREWYETRTASQLRSAATQAWNCCEAGSYQMARTYLAKLATEVQS